MMRCSPCKTAWGTPIHHPGIGLLPPSMRGRGNGPIDGFVDAIRRETGLSFDFVDYREHAMGHGANASAVAYVELATPDGKPRFGVGIDKNIVVASLKAVLSAVNRTLRKAEEA